MNRWLNTLYGIVWETKYGRFTTLIPKCEHFTLLVCPFRFLVIFSMRRLGNVQSFKHTCFAFELFAMNATPARRVTPPWDVYMANCHPGWQGNPTWQTGSPHLSCKRDQDKMRNYMDRQVTSPTWGPPPPFKQALKGFRKLHRVQTIKSRVKWEKPLKYFQIW